MTEENPSSAPRKASIGRITGLIVASLAIIAAVFWLVRQPVAEAIARSICEGQKLACKLSITRLDLGGITLTEIDARAPGATQAALAADEIAIDFAWDSLFALRPASVSGGQVTLRVDLTGKRPLLGDLDAAIANFTKPSDAPPGPAPQLGFEKVTIIGDTLSGPVQAVGSITATSADAFVIALAAPAASLGLDGATVQLAGAQLQATVAGENISAALNLDLSRFEASGASFADVKIDAKLEQQSGVLKGEGSARLGAIKTNDATLAGAEAKASLESAAIAPGAFDLEAWLTNVRRLEIAATTGEGRVSGAAWKSAQLEALVLPQPGGGSGGDISFSARDVSTRQALAGSVELSGLVGIARDIVTVSSGQARIRGGALTALQRESISTSIADALAAAIPAYADTARGAFDRAARAFDITAPWTATIARGATLSLGTGLELKAGSGLAMRLTGPSGASNVATLTTGDGLAWQAAGMLVASGGGAPALQVNLEKAEGSADRASLKGSVTLQPWKIGADTLGATLRGLRFTTMGDTGNAAASLSVQLNGALGGGQWKGVTAGGAVTASWSGNTFVADAPGGATIAWQEAKFGDSTFGAATVRYTPTGHLAQRSGKGLAGRGVLGAVEIPVAGKSWKATTRLGAVAIDWAAADGVRAGYTLGKSSFEIGIEEQIIALTLERTSGQLALTSGWKVTGAVDSGAASTNEARVSAISGKFDLAGQGDTVSGALSDITFRIADALVQEKRFEEAVFVGKGTLRANIADFSGGFTLAKSGVQIAQITGRHSLAENAGSLTFDRTPIIFAPRSFAPSDISPLLRGPANVRGRVDVAGGASWDENDFRASATLELRNLNFVLASAGIFEGVSGRIEVADLLTLKSAPDQAITIEKVTLGMPIEKGRIRFQLIGFDAIRLQGAEWPFVGGFIRVRPTDFKFATGEENRIVAQAVDWNLATLVEQFKVPDLKLQGTVGGDFPVVFRTGSADIDNAVLASTTPGVIQYSGSTTDAVAQTEQTTNMVFDALKDFRFQVLKVGLNGNIAGQMRLTLDMLGANPAVLNGAPFQMNIGIDSELAKLINSMTQSGTSVRDVIGQGSGTDP